MDLFCIELMDLLLCCCCGHRFSFRARQSGGRLVTIPFKTLEVAWGNRVDSHASRSHADFDVAVRFFCLCASPFLFLFFSALAEGQLTIVVLATEVDRNPRSITYNAIKFCLIQTELCNAK